jgi:uncharacterized protein with PQ loop repeat
MNVVGVAFMVTLYVNVNITIWGRGSQRTAATPIIIFNCVELVELVVVVVLVVIWVGVYNHQHGIVVGGLCHFVYVTRGHQQRG